MRRFFLLIAMIAGVLLAPACLASTPTVVQSSHSTGTTPILSPSTTFTAGNSIAVYCAPSSTSTTITVSDTNAVNTFTAIGNANNVQATEGSARWFVAKNISATTDQIRCTDSASSSFGTLIVYEVAGASTSSPVDVPTSSQSPGGSGTASANPSLSVTTTFPNDLIFFGAQCANTCAPASGSNGCSPAATNPVSDNSGDETETYPETATGTYTGCFAQVSGAYLISYVALTDGTGGGGGGATPSVDKRHKLEALLYWPFPGSAGLGSNYSAPPPGVLTVPQLDTALNSSSPCTPGSNPDQCPGTCVFGNESSVSTPESTGSCNVPAGDFVIINTTCVRPASTATLTDTVGDTIVSADPLFYPANDPTQNGNEYIWYIASAKGGTNVFTLACSSTSAKEIHVSAWKNMTGWTPDQHSFAHNSTGTSFSSGSITPTKHGELIFGYTFPNGNATPAASVNGVTPSGLTFVNGDWDDYQIECATCTNAVDAAFTVDVSGTWFAVVQSFMSPF